MEKMILYVLMLLIFSVAFVSTTVAQNQAGYTTTNNAASNNTISSNTAAAGSSNVSVTANSSTQVSPGVGTTSVTQLANVASIFGPNKAENINITQVNTVGGRWIMISNLGIATTNLTGWRLTNRENFAYMIPQINLDPGSSNATDLYTNSNAPLFNNNSDVITLLDSQGEIAAEYNISENAPATTIAPANAPLLINVTTPQSVKNPATQPILITPGATNSVQNPANAPVLITNPTQSNVTSNQTCPLGQNLCNGTCTDTSVDSQNCGKCGNICPANAVCINGVCSAYPSPGAQLP